MNDSEKVKTGNVENSKANNSGTNTSAKSKAVDKPPVETSMVSTANFLMILGIIGYAIAALISYTYEPLLFLAFAFGALLFVPLMMLPYYCAKVFAKMSENIKVQTEDLRAIKAAVESQNAPTASSSESQQTENAPECVPALDKEKNP